MIYDCRDLPFNAITGAISLSVTSLREDVRNFGFVLNRDRLFPGDLILTRSLADDGKFSSFTRDVQRKQYTNNHEWTHAAVYYHDWIIIEATPENDVSISTLLDRMLSHRFMVRRGRYILEKLDSGEVEAARAIGLTIALEASLMQQGTNYGKFIALSIFLRNRFGLNKASPNQISRRAVVCSGLYARAYRLAVGRGLLTTQEERNDESITPALLANSNELVTIAVGWAGLR